MSIKGFEVGGVQRQYDYTALDNIPANLVQDANYVHTDNNYTNADKTKLSGIEAQANKTTIDATLTHSGQAADAKATGDEINDLKSALDNATNLTGISTSYTSTQIDAQSPGTLTKSYKWFLGIVPANAEVTTCQMLVPANSTAIVKLEKWAFDDATTHYILSETIEGAIVEQVSNGYILDFGTFITEATTILTYSDESNGGWGKYVSDPGNSIQRVPSNVDYITPSMVSSTSDLKFERNLTYRVYNKIPKIVTVDADGNGDYTTVVEAVEKEEENTVIYIRPGVYEGTIQAFEKRIILIGTDRNKCILRSTDGRYAFPAINCACGYIENLTLISEYVSGESEEIGSSTNGAYAVHCESEYGVGDVLELHHCTLKSDFAPAMGVGLRKDFRLILDDCDLTNNQIIGRGNYTDNGTLGALYIHDSNGEQGNQYAAIKNCLLRSALGTSLTLYQVTREVQNNKVYCNFVNNVLFDKINRYSNNVWLRNRPFESNVFSIDVGYGNSNSVLNN